MPPWRHPEGMKMGAERNSAKVTALFSWQPSLIHHRADDANRPRIPPRESNRRTTAGAQPGRDLVLARDCKESSVFPERPVAADALGDTMAGCGSWVRSG